MKFTINRSQFNQLLTNANRAINPGGTIPALQFVKIELTNQKLVLTTSNADLTIVQSVDTQDDDNPITSIESGSLLLPARFLLNVVKKMSGKQVTVTKTDEDVKAKITSDQAKFNLPTLDASTYPHLPGLEDATSVTLNVGSLKTLYRQEGFAAYGQETRPILTGIFLTTDDKHQLIGYATDSHRLSKSIIASQGLEKTDKLSIILPKDNLKHINGLVNGMDDATPVTLFFAEQDSVVKFQVNNYQIYSRQLTGNYPTVDRLIPENFTSSLALDRKALLAVVERAQLSAQINHNEVVQLDFNAKKQTAKLSTKASDSSNPSTEEQLVFDQLVSENDEQALSISFNPSYLKDALQAFQSDQVVLKFNYSLNPFIIKATGTDNDNQFIHLVTPIRTF